MALSHSRIPCTQPRSTVRLLLVRPESARAATHDSSKVPIERGKVVEAGTCGDGQDGVIRSAQAHGRAMQARAQYELMRGHAGDLLENAQEMIGAHRGFAGEIG